MGKKKILDKFIGIGIGSEGKAKRGKGATKKGLDKLIR